MTALCDEVGYLPSVTALEAVADEARAVARDREDARGWAFVGVVEAMLRARRADDADQLRQIHFDAIHGALRIFSLVLRHDAR